jgi:CRP/FNR family cyclic AMP-dependent transcriptional regulator
MVKEELGTVYPDGATIIQQGDLQNCMYVIQSGATVVLQKQKDKEVFLAELGKGDFFGEMALFGRGEVRSATVRAKGEVRLLTVDKRTLLGRITADPTLAFRIIERMSSRIRDLDHLLTRIKASDRRNWDTRPEELAAGSE